MGGCQRYGLFLFYFFCVYHVGKYGAIFKSWCFMGYYLVDKLILNNLKVDVKIMILVMALFGISYPFDIDLSSS